MSEIFKVLANGVLCMSDEFEQVKEMSESS